MSAVVHFVDESSFSVSLTLCGFPKDAAWSARPLYTVKSDLARESVSKCKRAICSAMARCFAWRASIAASRRSSCASRASVLLDHQFFRNSRASTWIDRWGYLHLLLPICDTLFCPLLDAIDCFDVLGLDAFSYSAPLLLVLASGFSQYSAGRCALSLRHYIFNLFFYRVRSGDRVAVIASVGVVRIRQRNGDVLHGHTDSMTECCSQKFQRWFSIWK